MSEANYVLGHTDRELDRLDFQGELYRGVTQRTFVDAGIGPGMRVLDIGCGSGDVSRLVRELVGPTGYVLGVDRDEASVSSARVRTGDQANVSFEVADITAGDITDTFDALVGRFILMHQENPASALRAAAECVRPGGVVAMIESNMATLLDGQHSMPHSSVYDGLVRWKCEVVRAAGADIESGLRLGNTFIDAGLPRPTMRMESTVIGGRESAYYHYMIESVRSMLPQAIKAKITGIEEEVLPSLETALRDEVVRRNGSLVVWPVVSAWARVEATSQ